MAMAQKWLDKLDATRGNLRLTISYATMAPMYTHEQHKKHHFTPVLNATFGRSMI